MGFAGLETLTPPREVNQIADGLYNHARIIQDFRATVSEHPGLRQQIAECHTDDPAEVKLFMEHLVRAHFEDD